MSEQTQHAGQPAWHRLARGLFLRSGRAGHGLGMACAIMLASLIAPGAALAQSAPFFTKVTPSEDYHAILKIGQLLNQTCAPLSYYEQTMLQEAITFYTSASLHGAQVASAEAADKVNGARIAGERLAASYAAKAAQLGCGPAALPYQQEAQMAANIEAGGVLYIAEYLHGMAPGQTGYRKMSPDEQGLAGALREQFTQVFGPNLPGVQSLMAQRAKVITDRNSKTILSVIVTHFAVDELFDQTRFQLAAFQSGYQARYLHAPNGATRLLEPLAAPAAGAKPAIVKVLSKPRGFRMPDATGKPSAELRVDSAMLLMPDGRIDVVFYGPQAPTLAAGQHLAALPHQQPIVRGQLRTQGCIGLVCYSFTPDQVRELARRADKSMSVFVSPSELSAYPSFKLAETLPNYSLEPAFVAAALR